MSLTELQAQAAALNTEERHKLAAFLATLRMKETGEWDQATKRDDGDRKGWVSLDEAKRKLLDES